MCCPVDEYFLCKCEFRNQFFTYSFYTLANLKQISYFCYLLLKKATNGKVQSNIVEIKR